MQAHEEAIIKDAFARARPIAVILEDEALEAAVFPIWQDMIHAILKGDGCPCGTPYCFLVRPPEVQREYDKGNELGFDTFLSIIRAVRADAYLSLIQELGDA